MKSLPVKIVSALVILIIVLSALGYVFAETLIVRAIEGYGTETVGAKVEVGSSELSFSPLELSLKRVEVTNPDAPMTNAVEVDRIDVALDSSAILRRKVIVDSLDAVGVSFSTERSHSGAIGKAASGADLGRARDDVGRFEIPTLTIPSVDELIGAEGLQSLALITSFREDVELERERFRVLIDELPDREKFDGYRERIKSLKGGLVEGLVLC